MGLLEDVSFVDIKHISCMHTDKEKLRRCLPSRSASGPWKYVNSGVVKLMARLYFSSRCFVNHSLNPGLRRKNTKEMEAEFCSVFTFKTLDGILCSVVALHWLHIPAVPQTVWAKE